MMISNLLLWLAIPLLASPWLGGDRRLGSAVGQLVIAALGLGAMWQGAGTLDPGDLRIIAAQSTKDAWFVGISAGLLLAGACVLPAVRNWRRIVPALPLCVGVLIAGFPHLFPMLVGFAFGGVPTLLGWSTAGGWRSQGVVDAPASGTTLRPDGGSVIVGAVTVLTAVIGPAIVAMVGVAALTWREAVRHRRSGGAGFPVLPAIAVVAIAAWLWISLTVAGSPFPSLRRLATDAPVSLAAGQVMALLAIAWAIAIAAPWPLDRWASVVVLLPVAAVAVHLAAVHVTPEGIAHWQPLLSTALVIAVLAAMIMGRWDGAAAAVMLLGATRPAAIGFVGAALISLVPGARILRLPAPVQAAGTGVALALVLVTMLHEQVLLSVLLALGLASLAIRRDAVVARVRTPIHL